MVKAKLRFIHLVSSAIKVIHLDSRLELHSGVCFSLNLKRTRNLGCRVFLVIFDPITGKRLNLQMDKCLLDTDFPHRHILTPQEALDLTKLVEKLTQLATSDSILDLELITTSKTSPKYYIVFTLHVFHSILEQQVPLSKLEKILTFVVASKTVVA